MAVKEELIKKVAADLELSEDIVSEIISFQGQDALEYVKIVQELEFSGFGKFLLSQSKLRKKIKKYKEIELQGHSREEGIRASREILETKLR